MKQKILFLKGLPASGKSSFAKELVSRDENFVRVNKDDIREQIFGGKWSREREKTVIAIEEAMASEALKRGKSVIIDSTNLAPKHSLRYSEMAGKFNVDFETKFFYATVSECIKRDSKRENPVGEKVIRQMFDQFLRPMMETQDKSLARCYVFDLDGTLAKMNGRSPYEWNRVREDIPNTPIVNILQREFYYGDRYIIILSGRDGICLKDSIMWLDDNNIPFNHIFMRKEGDNRKDSIIKRELYDQNIRGKYYVEAWFDDRDQVVAMVRDELNIPCFQVDWGNF